MPRKALIEIHEKEGYLFVDFRGNGLIYKIPRMYEREVFSHINKEIKEIQGDEREVNKRSFFSRSNNNFYNSRWGRPTLFKFKDEY